MSILAMCGFEGRHQDRDQLVVVVGSYVARTSGVDLPPDSPSSTAVGSGGTTMRRPWWDHATGPAATKEPSTGECWYHFRYRTGRNDTTNDDGYVCLESDATEFLGLSWEDNTNKPTIRIGGVVVATAPTWAATISTYERYHVHVGGLNAGDEIRVYVDGNLASPILSYTLTAGDQSTLAGIGSGKPNGWVFRIANSDTNGRIDDLWALDPADGVGSTDIALLVDHGIRGSVVTADGTTQDWTGSFADIDERPASDADSINASAVDQVAGFAKAAIAGSADNVAAVQVLARVTRSDATTGTSLEVRLNDGVNTNGQTVAAPGDGDIAVVFNASADAAVDLTPANYDAAEIEFVSRA